MKKLRYLWFFCIELCSFPLFAGSYQVMPVTVEISPRNNPALLEITNLGAQNVTLHLEIVKWTQQDGKDIYLPTEDMLVVPPIFTIAPQITQTIRLAFRQSPDTTQELSYRLNVREVPNLDKTFCSDGGLNFMLNMSLPIFVKALNPIPPEHMWHLDFQHGNKAVLTFENTGGNHFIVTGLTVQDMDDLAIERIPQVFQYVLPQQSHSWVLDSKGVTKHKTIKINSIINGTECCETIAVG